MVLCIAILRSIITGFNGEIDNVRVTNNVVLASAYHGISWYGVNNSLIDHNTVINPTKNTHNLWIYIPKGKSGAPATGDTISNNVATGYVAGDPSVVKINDYIVTDPVATFQTFDPSSNSFNLQPKSGSIIDGKGAGASLSQPVAIGPDGHHYAMDLPRASDSQTQLAAVGSAPHHWFDAIIEFFRSFFSFFTHLL
jgi:parallel beta-helix repeat protein